MKIEIGNRYMFPFYFKDVAVDWGCSTVVCEKGNKVGFSINNDTKIHWVNKCDVEPAPIY